MAASLISETRALRELRAPRAMEEVPERARDRAVVAPMPFEAPVMKTRFLERLRCLGEMKS